jgi:PST family polysaccharide transporter
MIPKLFSFLKQKTTKNILINTFGNYLNVFFTAFFAFLLVRIMNPKEYGVLSVLLGIAYVLANILDFGVSASIYSYLPTIIEDRKKAFSFLKTTFTFQTFFSLIIIILLLIFFPALDRSFFKTQAPFWELSLTTFSVLFLIWQNYALNSLLAVKKIFLANFFLNLSNILKTILILFLFYLKLINTASIIFVFGIFGPLIFFLFLFFEKKHVFYHILKAPVKKEEFKSKYTLTFFIASQFFNLGTRMDLFLLSFYFPKTDAIGFYGLSTKIILTLFAAVTSITQVLSPDFAKIQKSKDLKPLLKKSFVYLLLPTFLFLILFLTPNQIFSLAFTEKFAKTASITKQLALAYILYPLANIPLLYLLYTVKKPSFVLIGNVIFFLITTFGCYFLIPQKGVFGPPLAIFFAILISSFYLTLKSIQLKLKN